LIAHPTTDGVSLILGYRKPIRGAEQRRGFVTKEQTARDGEFAFKRA
jgi:hypothetical protein